jgi:dipeptidyl-peptidase 4
MYQSAEFISLYAKTQRFSLGRPRAFTISKDSNSVFFLRAINASDPTLALFSFSITTQKTELLIDPNLLLDPHEAGIPAAEKARRERMRELGLGITSYQLDDSGENICFALNGKLFIYQIQQRNFIKFSEVTGVVDPKISPNSKFAAAVIDNGITLFDLTDLSVHSLISPTEETISYGLANFIAAEEFSRISGFWWAPDSQQLLVEKVDSVAVSEIHLADPTDPTKPPRTHRYPFAGGSNPISSLVLINLAGDVQDLNFLSKEFEYLINAGFKNKDEIFITLLSREQSHLQVKLYDFATKAESVFFTQQEEPWVEIYQPLPKFFEDQFVHLAGEEHQKIVLNGEQIPNQNFEVRSIVEVTDQAITALVSVEPQNLAMVEISSSKDNRWITPADSYASGIKQKDTLLLVEHNLKNWQPEFNVIKGNKSFRIENLAGRPNFEPNISIEYLAGTNLYAAVITPSNYQNEKLPVILSPYSGPHAQRVLNSASGFVTEQFLAEQGFLVVVIDSRGTSGRGKEFAQSIKTNWASKVLADQIDGLQELVSIKSANFDLTRVGIKGWSFGGYLAAYAVLQRSDFFKAAIAGAPVTDWRWYDTAYSERYLGQVNENLAAYEENSLINKAKNLKSPLLLIHGLADDNVLAMHSLKLSGALFANAKAHNFISLSGVSHMAGADSTVENLLKN